MTEADKVKILCEKAREVHREIEREYENVVTRAEELNELNKVLEGVDAVLQDNENLRSEIDDLRAELDEERKQRSELEMKLDEERKQRSELEMKLNEMSKLSTGMAKKAPEEDLFKAFRTYANRSKRKTADKRTFAKSAILEIANANGLVLPEDLRTTIESLDDEQAEPKVVNVTGNYNDIHDNKAVKMKE